MRVLVTGYNGQLGFDVVRRLESLGIELAVTRGRVGIARQAPASDDGTTLRQGGTTGITSR